MRMFQVKGKFSSSKLVLFVVFLFLFFGCYALCSCEVFAGVKKDKIDKLNGDCSYFSKAKWVAAKEVLISDLQDSANTGNKKIPINQSIYHACNENRQDGLAHGALWITSFKTSSLAAVIPTTNNDGIVDAYLAGVVINDSGVGQYATNICIWKGTSEKNEKKIISGSTAGFAKDCEKIRKDNGSGGVTVKESEIWRPGYKFYTNRKQKKKNTAKVTFGTIDVEININDIINDKSIKPTVYGNFDIYQIPLQVYRCYGRDAGVYNNDNGIKSCRSNTTTLFIPIIQLPCKDTDGYCGSELKLVQKANGKEGTSVVSGLNKSKSERSTSGSTTIYARPGGSGVTLTGSFESSNQIYKGNKKTEQLSIVDAKTDVDPGTFTNAKRHRQNAKKLKNGTTDWTGGHSEGWNNNPNSIEIEDYVSLFYNSNFPDLKDKANKGGKWNNAFTVVTDESVAHGGSSLVCNDDRAKIGTKGSNDKFKKTINYVVKAGSKLHSQSRLNDHTNGCTKKSLITPFSIQFHRGASFDLYKATINNTSQRTSKLEVIVPYNFINSTEIGDKNDETVYAGEKRTINYNIKASPKDAPSVVGGDKYLTYVPKVYTKAQISYDGGGSWSDMDGTYEEYNNNPFKLSDTATYTGTQAFSKSVAINIPDSKAGSRLCVRFGVYPAMSQNVSGGNDGRSTDGNGKWAFPNEKKCYTIAKKPSFQIWGGSLYSNGNISLPTVTKKIKNNEDKYIKRTFGSWVEFGISSEGKVEGLASGAGTGYARTDDARKIIGSNYDSINSSTRLDYLGGIGVTDTSNFCNISTLSIPNNKCKSDYVGRNNSTSVDPNANKSDLVAMFNKTDDTGGYTLEKVEGNKTINSEETLSQYTTHVTKATGDVTIAANIKYENGGYTALQQIPKRIIYANNIKINCNVTRIDAVLIAEGDINTCANSSDENSPDRSTQLIINGATISNTLTLNRTYGAATGANSAIPAEIINYDTSLYLWARKNDDMIRNGAIIEKNRRELPPRY